MKRSILTLTILCSTLMLSTAQQLLFPHPWQGKRVAYFGSGLYPMTEEHGMYFHDPEVDRLHPNDLGHERMASTLLYQLLTLPVF